MFTIPVLPVTANHLYDKSLRKNKKTGKTTLSFNNKQEVEDLRMFVRVQMKRAKINWKPTGYCYVVIFVESSKWLNKDNTPKCKDIDNMPKSLNDAIMRATGIPDEMNFGVMEFKVPSEVERTRVFMYDMGVDHYFMEKDNGKGT
jgi:Holliday junction resolvase RusA-like endonuclease